MSIGVIAASYVAAVSGNTGYQSAVLADTPLAYFRLNEPTGTTVRDSSGNARDGQYSASGIVRGAAGLLASDSDVAVGLDGNGYVEVAHAAWQSPANFTLEAWIKPTNITGPRVIIAKDDNGVNGPYRMRLNGGGTVNFLLWTGAMTQLDSTAPLNANQTYHVVATYDGAMMRLYINGVLNASVAKTGALNSNTTPPVRIGAYGAGEFFVGTLDEPAIYGTALSAARVLAHYNAGSAYATEVLTDAPAAYYRLNEVSGTEMSDTSGNARNGALVGTPILQATGLVASDLANKAIDFNGTSQYGDVPYGAWMQPATWTVEAFIKPDMVTRAGGGIPILARHHSSQYQYWMLMLSGGKLVFEGRIGTSNTTAVVVTGTTTLAVGTTYHVAATFDGTSVQVYLNGVLEATGGAGAAGSPPTIDLSIGSLTDGYAIGSGWAFDGVIDEVAVYGTALSAARLLAHYKASLNSYARIVLADAPMAYYRLGEAAGPTMLDSSTNGRHGTYGASTAAPVLGAASLIAPAGNTAANFDGVDDYGVVGYATWMGSTDLTVEAWIKLDVVGGAIHTIAARWSSTGTRPWFFAEDAGKLRFASSAAGADVIGATTLVAGQVYHVVATHTGTTARLYVNGVADGVLTTFSRVETGLGIRIGRMYDTAYPLDGIIDEVAIYPVVLTPAQILAHYNAGL